MVAEHDVNGRIRQLRFENDVKQQDLAKALGISTSALRNLEHGETKPRLSTLEMLADFFGVSLDWIVRGIAPTQDSGNGLDAGTLYRTTGLNDSAVAFMKEEMERGDYCGGLNEYIATLNGLVTGGLLGLVWGLCALNKELVRIDAEIKKVSEETPKPDDIIAIMQLDDKLNPLKEQRDLLKLRYLRRVERVFDNLIEKEDVE